MATNTTQTVGQARNGEIVVAALYRFAPFSDFADHREPLTRLCERHGVRGTLLLADEGINGTIAGNRGGIDAVITYIRNLPGFNETDVKESFAAEMPFARMKVRLKKEIVTLGVPGIDPNRTVGTYVAPEEWNTLISDPDTIVIDTRNDYEVEIGTFEGAINPQTTSFREFPEWVKSNLAIDKPQKVAMFCTGGIRCEKATALLKKMGFNDVYHLKGGILKYLEEIPANHSLWHGECFVFDQRVSVGHELTPGPYQLCSACRKPFLSGQGQGGYADTLCADCSDRADDDKKARAAARQKQIDLAKARGESHIGPSPKATKDA